MVPRWRWAVRWPMVGLTAAALGAVVTAYFSGRNFLDATARAGEQSSAVELHEERAEVLFWVTIVFAVAGACWPRGAWAVRPA